AELLQGQSLVEPIAEEPAMTSIEDFTVMGRDQQRIDAVARVTGRAIYSQDVQVEGMLFAHVIRPPSFGARLESFDASVAEQMPGVVQVARDGNLLAVLAESDEAAELAARVVQADWAEQPGQPSRWDMPSLLLDSGTDDFTMQEAGDLDAGFAAADEVLESTYYIPYITNAPMEPRAAVARWDGDHLEVWAGTQRPFGIRSELAQLFELDENAVRVIAPEIGGGFGGK